MSEAERGWIASRIADLLTDFINTSADERADEIRELLSVKTKGRADTLPFVVIIAERR